MWYRCDKLFTGIIQSVGKIAHIQGSKLSVVASLDLNADPIKAGESIAVNGCCLTALADGELSFDLSPETRLRTSFHHATPGTPVNLERAMRPIDRFGGHIVQGHVDAVGEVVTILQDGDFTVFRFRSPEEFDRYLIDKGSVSVDGVSLTVVNPIAGEFDVWVVPHTIENTNLGIRRPGELVNLEFDVLAKHIEKLIQRD
ncbi:MAG: riboflavin synthase [Chlorobia bacterium]|nr:riboflavin synthase [Fimbriimonadaceae bacterium]